MLDSLILSQIRLAINLKYSSCFNFVFFWYHIEMETILVGLVIIVISAILHEVAHGYVADRLGDPTARLAGRLTLNPLPHIDPMMSILMPYLCFVITQGQFIFAAAKPVPVNPLMLKEGRKDLALVALAGPVTNILIALIAALLLRVFEGESIINMILSATVFYNLMLGFLNLIPFPPLDGSKLFSILLPETMAQRFIALAPFGILLPLLLIATPLGDFLWMLVHNAASFLGVSLF